MKRLVTVLNLLLYALSFSQNVIAEEPPKLVVAISIDQFRPDYLKRLRPWFLPAKDNGAIGGFRYLMEEGSYYPNGRVPHFPTYTGPGHAAIMTGTTPAVHGIIGNLWYSREYQSLWYCVGDPTVEPIGYDVSPPWVPVSPRTMLTTTVGDELKLATNDAAKVVGIAIKDRASILMAGHKADTAIWFDSNEGQWVTTTYFEPDDKLPTWVRKLNKEKLPDKAFGETWEPLVPEALAGSSVPEYEGYLVANGMSQTFPHTLVGSNNKIDKSFYRAWYSSGLANDFVVETALAAVDAEELGKDAISDVLALSFSTNDYVGHYFGPNSPEVYDTTVRTDRALARLFTELDKRIGINNVVIALTSDHGVAPIPEDTKGRGVRSGEVVLDEVTAALDRRLNPAFGDQNWIVPLNFTQPNIYFNEAALAAVDIDREDFFDIAAQAIRGVKGVAQVWTREQVEERELPNNTFSELIYAGFHPARSGDLLLITEPYWFVETDRYNTTHGTPYGYDTDVPILIAGKGIASGVHYRRVTTMDVAPTLSYLMGVVPPNGNLGEPLVEALRK